MTDGQDLQLSATLFLVILTLFVLLAAHWKLTSIDDRTKVLDGARVEHHDTPVCRSVT